MTLGGWIWREVQAEYRGHYPRATVIKVAAPGGPPYLTVGPSCCDLTLQMKSMLFFISFLRRYSLMYRQERTHRTICLDSWSSLALELEPAPSTLPRTLRPNPILQMIKLRPETHSISFRHTHIHRQETHKGMLFHSLTQLIRRWGIAFLAREKGLQSSFSLFFFQGVVTF